MLASSGSSTAVDRPVGSRLMTARYTHFSAAVSVGKCPRALTALRILLLIDSIALVV